MQTISQPVLTFLLNAAWQIAAIAAIAALADLALRKGPAAHRYTLWTCALIAALALPAASLRTTRPASSSLVPASAVPAGDFVNGRGMRASASTHTAPRQPDPARDVSIPVLGAALALTAYAGFLCWRGARFGLALLATARLRSKARTEELPDTLRRVSERCVEAFGMQGVDVLRSTEISSPVAAGFRNPAVIVPDSLWNSNSEEVLTAAIGHEFAHIARRDFGVNLLLEILSLPVSFHPACWWMRRKIERSREMACDEAVATRLMTRRRYAESIVRFAELTIAPIQPGYTLGVFDGNALEQRIRSLLTQAGYNARRARAVLIGAVATLVVCGVIVSTLSVSARAQSGFTDQMRAAAEAYNAHDFPVAVEGFRAAVQSQPENMNARLFLANALLRVFYTGDQNLQLREEAREQYKAVLERDAASKQALAGMLSMAMDDRKVDEARTWAAKLVGVAPDDASAWYTSGVLQWMTVYPEYGKAKQLSGSPVDQYRIPDANLRTDLRNRYLGDVEKGLQMLDRALQLDPRRDDAMAYMNLMFRLKAAMVDDERESASLIATADEWVKKALAARGSKPKEPAAPTALNVDGPPPGPAEPPSKMIKAPPPPPPPPPPASRDLADKPASDTPRPAGGPPLVGKYWQVIGVPGTSAIGLFKALTQSGFQAAIHAGSDRVPRVVAGPYFDDASFESGRQNLELKGFRVVRKW